MRELRNVDRARDAAGRRRPPRGAGLRGADDRRGQRGDEFELPASRRRSRGARAQPASCRRCGAPAATRPRPAALLGLNRDQIRYRIEKFGSDDVRDPVRHERSDRHATAADRDARPHAGDPAMAESLEPRRDPLRPRPGRDRRDDRPARHHHLRQRQVLRDLEVLARRADRPGPSHHQLRLSPEGVHPRVCGGRSPRARCGAASSATARRTDRSTGSTRRSCRSSTAAESRGSTSRSAATSRSARSPRRSCASRRRWRSSASSRPSSRTKCAIRWPACGPRCRCSTRRVAEPRDREIIAAMIAAHRRAQRQGRGPAALCAARSRRACRPSTSAALIREMAASARRGNRQRRAADRGVGCRRRCARTADPDMLRAALLNLAINACQAAAARAGRRQRRRRRWRVPDRGARSRARASPPDDPRAGVRAVLHDAARRHRARPGDRQAVDGAAGRHRRAAAIARAAARSPK